MNAAREIKRAYPNCHISWITKNAFSRFLKASSCIDEVYTLESDFSGKVKSIKLFIQKNKFDIIYDAHRNLRTWLLRLSLFFSFTSVKWIFRPKSRLKRILFFKLKINLFPNPFFAKDSYLSPIKFLLLPDALNSEQAVQMNYAEIDASKFSFIDKPYLLFAPSAAWEMKRWPINHWKDLVKNLSGFIPIVFVGGPNDKFISELYDHQNINMKNLAGQTSFLETFFLVQNAIYTLSADTGVIHVAELLGKNGGLLQGPTAFGRIKNSSIRVFEAGLPCSPCSKDGRGKCSRAVYQECMTLLTPKSVESDIRKVTSSL